MLSLEVYEKSVGVSFQKNLMGYSADIIQRYNEINFVGNPKIR